MFEQLGCTVLDREGTYTVSDVVGSSGELRDESVNSADNDDNSDNSAGRAGALQEHREKIPGKLETVSPFTADANIYSAETQFGMVHQQLQPKEWMNRPECKAAVQKEYDQLVKLKAWDYNGVQEWSTVKARAEKSGKTV